MRGSASRAMRMNERQDTSIAVANPACEQSVMRLCKSSFGAYAIECSRKSRRPIIADTREHGFELAWFTDVAGHHDRTFKLRGERPDKWLGFRIEVRDRDLGARAAKHPCTAISDAAFVGDADDQTPLTLE
jgi:hypothetical protein